MSMHKQSIYFYAKTSYTNFKQDTAKGNRFLELAKKYINFSKLTTPMLNKFINKIIVHIPEKVDGDRVQEMKIYPKFIGRFDHPTSKLMPEEKAAGIPAQASGQEPVTLLDD